MPKTYNLYTRDWAGDFQFSRSVTGFLYYGKYYIAIVDKKDQYAFIGSKFWTIALEK